MLYNASFDSSCSDVFHSEFKKKISKDAHMSHTAAQAKMREQSILSIRKKTKDNVYTCKQKSLCSCIILSDNIHSRL
jgi:hypothetical protein